MFENFLWGNSSRTRDDLGVGEQVQWLTDVDDLYRALLIGCVEDCVQLLDIDGVGFEEETFAPAPVPLSDSQTSGKDQDRDYHHRQAHEVSLRLTHLRIEGTWSILF